MEDFMLEDYYVKPSTVDRVRASWLAPQIESYLEWLEFHRYSRLVVYRRLPVLFHFEEFVQKKGCKDIASCKAYIKEVCRSGWSNMGRMKRLPLQCESIRSMQSVACGRFCSLV